MENTEATYNRVKTGVKPYDDSRSVTDDGDTENQMEISHIEQISRA